MSTILFCPRSRKMRNGKTNPKDYPHWLAVIRDLAQRHHIVQIGADGEQPIPGAQEHHFGSPYAVLKGYLDKADMILGVDNFLQHFAALYGKRGVVIFGQSDPRIFGCEGNDNILVHPDALRQYQFQTWEEIEYRDDVWPDPQMVVQRVEAMLLSLQNH